MKSRTGFVNQSRPPTSSLLGCVAWITTTTSPAMTTAAIVVNFVTTKKPFNCVLVFVLIEFATLMITKISMERSLCSILSAWLVMPAAE